MDLIFTMTINVLTSLRVPKGHDQAGHNLPFSNKRGTKAFFICMLVALNKIHIFS